MEQIVQTRSVPVMGSYDVVVCGGGPGGWPLRAQAPVPRW